MKKRIRATFATVCLASLFPLTSTAQSEDTIEAEPLIEAPAAPPTYRPVDPENLLLIETLHGQVAVELNSDFAPAHSAQMRMLARDMAYDGTAFYRVIDGFVAQGGLQDEDAIAAYPNLTNENDRPMSESGFVPLGNADLFAPIVGHIDGFAVGRSETLGTEWLLHCPGAMAMARGEDPDSGGTEFYIVLDAQRYLDRNLTVFGRVLDGMEHLQALKRGERENGNGVIKAPEKGDAIISIRVAADLPEDTRPAYEVMDVSGEAFETAKQAKRVRDETFFYRKPPEMLDICGFEVPTRLVSANSLED
ncbi:MAG: peptidylprolyl isomerase [Henriciella sp.]